VRALGASVAASLAVLVTYLALGGASYKPADVADPCEPRPIEAPEGLDATLQQLALSALDGAACELRVTREDLLAALADPETRVTFLDESEVSDEALEATLRAGLDRAYDDAVEAGAIGGVEAFLIGGAIELAPVDVIVDIAQSESGQEAAAELLDLAQSEAGEDAFDVLGDLLD
jgi:hypothetical protein